MTMRNERKRLQYFLSDHSDIFITRYFILIVGIGVMLVFTFLPPFTKVRKGK